MKIPFIKKKYHSLKKILLIPRDLALLILDFFAIFTSFKKNSTSGLIVRVDNIGDFILWLPAAEKLCHFFLDNKKPAIVCNQAVAEFAAATGLFSQVLAVDIKRLVRDFRYRWNVLRRISRLGATVAIQPTYSRVFLIGDSLIRASRASSRIGSRGDKSNIRPWQKAISDRWYTLLVNAVSAPIMELERNAEFLRNLGVLAGALEAPFIPKLMDLPASLVIKRDYFVLFPGASLPIKQWPLDSFAAVAIEVNLKRGWIPVICGGPTEQQLCARLQEKINCSHAINLAGETSLLEMIEVLRGASLLISNDTSAVHIAAAVGVPSVCILGGGHYERFMPYSNWCEGAKPIAVIKKMHCFGCNWTCRYSDDNSQPYPCVEGVTIEQVQDAIESAL
jgi:ADP-heptose:LPS heptosyltransferase